MYGMCTVYSVQNRGLLCYTLLPRKGNSWASSATTCGLHVQSALIVSPENDVWAADAALPLPDMPVYCLANGARLPRARNGRTAPGLCSCCSSRDRLQ